jgi:hypothetical protein
VAETFYTLAKRSSPKIAEEFLSRLPSLPIRVVVQISTYEFIHIVDTKLHIIRI